MWKVEGRISVAGNFMVRVGRGRKWGFIRMVYIFFYVGLNFLNIWNIWVRFLVFFLVGMVK